MVEKHSLTHNIYFDKNLKVDKLMKQFNNLKGFFITLLKLK